MNQPAMCPPPPNFPPTTPFPTCNCPKLRSLGDTSIYCRAAVACSGLPTSTDATFNYGHGRTVQHDGLSALVSEVKSSRQPARANPPHLIPHNQGLLTQGADMRCLLNAKRPNKEMKTSSNTIKLVVCGSAIRAAPLYHPNPYNICVFGYYRQHCLA